MTTLLSLDDTALQTLATRTREVCIAYPAHPLPPGCSPDHARIGVETGPDGTVCLFVDRGIAYEGGDTEVHDWLGAGLATFPDLGSAVAWLTARLAGGDPANRGGIQAPGRTAGRRDPSTLTDLGAVVAPDPAQPLDPETLAADLRQAVVGQDAALEVLARLSARHTAKRRPRRPASVLLLGPTGVGKTQSANELARALQGLGRGGWGHLRLDMAEYSERAAVSRLVGASPGYIGYGDASLASRLRDNPRHVVVLDEIEKAHHEVLLALMNLMDAGRLGDQSGAASSAAEAILVFTSNLGAADLPSTAGLSETEMDDLGRRHLLDHGMAPELVGRIGRVMIYGPLSQQAQALVVVLATARLGEDFDLEVRAIHPAWVSDVLAEVDTSRGGMRRIEHAVERRIGAALAQAPAGAEFEVAADGSLVVTVVDAPRVEDDGADTDIPETTLSTTSPREEVNRR